jgi:hypothetical protein
MATMFEIDRKTQDYSAAHQVLRDRMQELDEQITAIKKKLLPGIRRAVEVASEKKYALKDMIEDSSELFEKPKTRILHGVKVGFQKGKGKLDWDDDELVVKLIKKNFPEQADMLIKTTEKPRKDGLNGLDVKDLRKIGVTAEDTGDQVVIKPTDSEIDKLVDALLKESEEPEAA